MDRREFIGSTLGLVAGSVAIAGCKPSHTESDAEPKKTARWQNNATRWPICLDTATLAKEIPLAEKVKLAAKAGFDAIEPWDRELKEHMASGGNLKDLGQQIVDLGMFVPSVIGVWGALAPDKETFRSESDQHKERLAMIHDIGSSHAQIIPKFGLNEPLNHDNAAWAYSQICEMAKQYDLKPAVIFLNFVKGLERLSDAVDIAMLSGQQDAKVIPDTYHMFLGGSSPHGLGHLNKDFIAIFQFADAGHDVKPSTARGIDGKRVLPGDGQLPLVDYLKPLKKIGYEGCISLELYNQEYRKRPPGPFLEEALRKTVAVVASVDA